MKERFSRAYLRTRAFVLAHRIVTGIAVLIVIVAIFALAHSSATVSTPDSSRTVTLATVASLSGNQSGVGILGSVRSVAQADVVAQAGGTVRAIHTKLGATVAAGAILAELSNASEAASVLQAQGGYDAAIAARSITTLQSGNSASSFTEAQLSARNTYNSTYTSVDTVLTTEVDTFFGVPTAVGPELLISRGQSGDSLPRARAALSDLMDTWRASLATSNTADPETLLNTAQANVQTVSTFLNNLAAVANLNGSNTTAAQAASLAQARTTIAGLLTSISAARDTYEAKKTAAAVGQTQTKSTDASTASADASVEQALGALRAAQAAYEKTVIRAPIGGTINYFSLHIGDYIAPMARVATVAHNNALEVVAYVSSDDRNLVGVGDTVKVGDSNTGIITSVSPALDPTTKQIEVDIAVNGTADLVDGESVQITLPDMLSSTSAATTPTTSSTTPASLQLPLSAVKLRATDRVVYTVDAQGKLVANPVTIGEVIGDKIEILSPLSPELKIVTDARGLSEGDTVLVSTSTPTVATNP